MDMRRYYQDLKKTEESLEQHARDGIVYVTSLYHRDRNSIEGKTLSASLRNAARVITDQTHRLATDEEITRFFDLQEESLKKSMASEQRKRKQFVVVSEDARGVLERPEFARTTKKVDPDDE